MLGVVIFSSFVGLEHVAAQPADHPQCRDPLFETHWAGKNDIQVLSEYPHLKSNLKLCPAFNERSSCCHQTFETEQQKYFEFWRKRFGNIFLRMNAHRESVVAAAGGSLSRQDLEQYKVVLERYRDALQFGRHQRGCFTKLLTYTAGMMCFSCRTDWFYFAVLSGQDSLANERVLRVRMTRSVCLDLWFACEGFSSITVKLQAAIRDSKVARSAQQAVENLDMFAGQQQLCDWAHDQLALHPFLLPTAEDRQTQWRRLSQGGNSSSRRLQRKEELNVLEDGAMTGFDLLWRPPAGLPPSVTASAPRIATSLLALVSTVMSLALLTA